MKNEKIKKTKKKKKKENKPIVPDTSVIINGILSEMIEKGEIKNTKIIIPKFVMEELQAQASRGREIGFKGLEEIKKLGEFEKGKNIHLDYKGRRQTYEEIQLAKYGRIDALIIDVAKQNNAILYTSDIVQKMAAEAEGIETKYFEPYEKEKVIELDKLLTPDTMSLHMKEGAPIMAKRGKPGAFKLVKISSEPLTKEKIEAIIKEIMDATRYEEDSFIEIGGHAATVVQLKDMRISIARPPFSDGVEVTVVRPIVKAMLDDYKLADKLKQRLAEKADGVLIAGPPGSGKSTFAAALAEFYEEKGKIVKTMESPRDLQVKPEITQYTALHGSFEKTADILLLVRPDYTVFDEVRKTNDFKIFSDLRLAGIGMIGVVHATEPIDAIQRFMSRIELGMLPHVIDTIIYIKNGTIKKVYSLSMTVRTPTGMKDEDLSRPIVEVREFDTNKLVYEIYTYGEENIIVPVTKKEEHALHKLAKQQIMNEIKKYDKNAEIEFLSPGKILVKVENKKIPRIIGKKGSTVQALEKKLGISIDIAPKVATLGEAVEYSWEESGAYLIFSFDKKLQKKQANFYIDKNYLFSATIGRSGQVRVKKTSDLGKQLLQGLATKKINVFI